MRPCAIVYESTKGVGWIGNAGVCRVWTSRLQLRISSTYNIEDDRDWKVDAGFKTMTALMPIWSPA